MEIGIYLTFAGSIEECKMKLTQNSLILEEEIDATILQIGEGRQIKFKNRVVDFKLFNREFQPAKMAIQIRKKSKPISHLALNIPFHLYNLLSFHPPTNNTPFPFTTDWHTCCPELTNNHPHFIHDFLPLAVQSGSTFSIRAKLREECCELRVIISEDKFSL